MTRMPWFWIGGAALVALAWLATHVVDNPYPFFAGEVVLQFVVLATAWNITGGYAGYVNFGTAGFFGAGAYAAAAAARAWHASPALQLAAALVVGGVLGLGVGYLSARLRGIYYSIATIAVAVIVEAIIVNWPYVGGAQGLAIVRPAPPAGFASYTAFLFVEMAALAVAAVAIARAIERSRLGLAFGAIRDNEAVAEACGVPTLRVKCLATALSGALMAAAGAPFALYMSYIDPPSAFSMNFSLSALAMALLGGTASWPGPVIGAALLASLEQVLAVTVSAELNLFVVGVVMVASVVCLPGGLYRALAKVRRSRRTLRANRRSIA